jgi:hypothetical protein
MCEKFLFTKEIVKLVMSLPYGDACFEQQNLVAAVLYSLIYEGIILYM